MRNPIPRILAPLLGVLALAVGGPAAADTCAQFTASNIDVTYDPLGAQGVTQVAQTVSLRVARGTETASTGIVAQFVDWDSDAALRIGTNGPIYTIEGGNTVAVNRYGPALLSGQYFEHTFQSANTGVYETVPGLQFFVDPGQDIPAGVYDESLDIQYRCLTGNPNDLSVNWQSAVLHVSVNVPSKLIANLSGSSTSGTLDFGDFSDRARSAMVNVYSTGPFTVKIDSDNSGRMVLDGTSDPGADAQIAYGVSFDGSAVKPGAQMHFFRTGIGGAGFPLVASTTDLTGKRAGIYRDTLTVTITPSAL